MAKNFNFFKRKPITLTGETTEEWIKMYKKKFNVNDYKGKYVMHCKTEEEALDFCKVLHEAGRTWSSGASYSLHTMWKNYKGAMCYNFNSNGYCGKDFYEKQNYTILEWEDFMGKKEFTKADLKSGDIVTYRNGIKGMVFLELGAIVNDNLNEYSNLSNITSELTSAWDSKWDIVKIQRAEHIRQFLKSRWDKTPIVWEREETVEMTLAEVCKALGKNVKIVKE